MQTNFVQLYDLDITNQKTGEIEGYGSIFNNVDLHGDVILNGAFSESLSTNSKIKLLWQHDPNSPIGIISEIEETDVGLYIKAVLNLEIPKAKEAYLMIKSGIIDGLSIGFEAEECSVVNDVRYIEKAKLWEVSIVTFPANQEALITDCKSIEQLYSKYSQNVSLVLKKLNNLLIG